MDDQTVELLKIQMRIAREGLRTSLVDLTDEEFYWQPVPNCWTMTYHDLHHGAEISCLRDLYQAMKGE